MILSPEQQEIIRVGKECSNSMMIQAYAGCAKSTTIELLAHALPPKPSLALAFNVKIKKDLELRLPKHISVMTLNGLGHRAWSKAIRKAPIIDEGKNVRLLNTFLKERDIKLSPEEWDSARLLIEASMNNGLVPSEYPHKSFIPDDDDGWRDLFDLLDLEYSQELREIARIILIKAIQESFAGKISFTDQIYMSVMFNGEFQRYPLVLVDEAQDLSPMNHKMVSRSASDRIIAVGDKLQSIYAFRGADCDSMENLRSLRKDWIDLPLTLTWRCPRVIVDRVQNHAPGFTAAPQNAEGEIKILEEGWTWYEISHYPNLAILCRNNAPLFRMAFKLLAKRVPVMMLGRDIGKSLSKLYRKIVPKDDISIAQAIQAVEMWAQTESEKFKDKPHKLDSIEDRASSLMAIIYSCRELREVLPTIEKLFSRDSAKVTLASGHRAKGLEWDTVLHLDPWRIPSRYAISPKAIIQENNLRYVLETRTKRVLLLGNFSEMGE